MMACPECGARFENREEIDAHAAQVHDERWTGPRTFSEAGDEGATGAISPRTADTIATRGGLDRPDARTRALSMQKPEGSP